MKKISTLSAFVLMIFATLSFTACNQNGGDAAKVAEIFNECAQKINDNPADFQAISDDCDKQISRYANSTEELTAESLDKIVDSFTTVSIAAAKTIYGYDIPQEAIDAVKAQFREVLSGCKTVGEAVNALNNLPE